MQQAILLYKKAPAHIQDRLWQQIEDWVRDRTANGNAEHLRQQWVHVTPRTMCPEPQIGKPPHCGDRSCSHEHTPQGILAPEPEYVGSRPLDSYFREGQTVKYWGAKKHGSCPDKDLRPGTAVHITKIRPGGRIIQVRWLTSYGYEYRTVGVNDLQAI